MLTGDRRLLHAGDCLLRRMRPHEPKCKAIIFDSVSIKVLEVMVEKMQYKESLDMDSFRMEIQGVKDLSTKGRNEATKLSKEILATKKKMTVGEFESNLGHMITSASEEAELKCRKLGTVIDEFDATPNWMWEMYKRTDDCGLVGSWSKTVENRCLLEMTSEYHGYCLLYCLVLDKLNAEMWAIVEGANIRYTWNITAR